LNHSFPGFPFRQVFCSGGNIVPFKPCAKEDISHYKKLQEIIIFIKKSMRYFFIIFIVLAFNTGCKPKILSGKDLENKLMETMGDYLHKTLNPAVQIKVKDVIYYPEVKEKTFICEFHVQMNYNGKDTTGIVSARISNDFQTIKRTQ
jgi:hypothetical protein